MIRTLSADMKTERYLREFMESKRSASGRIDIELAYLKEEIEQSRQFIEDNNQLLTALNIIKSTDLREDDLEIAELIERLRAERVQYEGEWKKVEPTQQDTQMVQYSPKELALKKLNIIS